MYCTVSSNIFVTLITNSSVKFLHVIHEFFNVNLKFFFNNWFLKQVSCRQFNNKFRRLENIFKAKLQKELLFIDTFPFCRWSAHGFQKLCDSEWIHFTYFSYLCALCIWLLVTSSRSSAVKISWVNCTFSSKDFSGVFHSKVYCLHEFTTSYNRKKY